MHKGIQIREEGARGCGYRKPGGLYLFSDGPGRFCGFLPIVLTNCPTCGHSMQPDVGKQNRGFSWIENFGALIENDTNSYCAHPEAPKYCEGCPMSDASRLRRVGLIWIGKEFYRTPKAFTDEAEKMGISRRLPMTQTVTIKTAKGERKVPAIPRGLTLGKTWVALAHPEVVKNPDPPPAIKPDATGIALFEAEQDLQAYKRMLPGIFYMYRPDRVEYVMKPEELNDDEFVEYLLARGITPVHVKKLGTDDSPSEIGDQGSLPFSEKPTRKVVGKKGNKSKKPDKKGNGAK